MKTLEAGKRIALNNILFATDFSALSDAALPYAAAIAQHYGARLYGAHIVSSADYFTSVPDLWPAQVQPEEQLQQEVAARLKEQLDGIPHQALFGVGDVWNAISRLVSDHDIDLLVLGTHGRTGPKRLLIGSVAEKIFRQAACPVLTVGPHVPRQPDGEIHFRHILLATDFGQESLASLPYAFSLAEEDQAELTLLHVVQQPAAGIVNFQAASASLMRRLKELVPPEAETWCHVECLVEFGSQFALPADRILEIATDHAADLIVLGLHRTRAPISTVTRLAQTTAQHVVAHAKCPVLTIRG